MLTTKPLKLPRLGELGRFTPFWVKTPALDGHGVDIVFRRTSKMTKAEVNELIEFIEAWRAMQ